MKISDYGQQGRCKVSLTRRDLERLTAFLNLAAPDQEASVIVGLKPENDFGWAIPDPSEHTSGCDGQDPHPRAGIRYQAEGQFLQVVIGK